MHAMSSKVKSDKKEVEKNRMARKKYVIGFTVHEARELSQSGEAVDPMVVVRALGREYKTELKRGRNQHVKFEESFIWNDFILNDEEFDMSYIDFELQAANVLFRNDIIGKGKVQLAMVHKRPNHCYSQKWLQLTKDTSMTARLKVSVFCYAEGDTPPRPEDIEHDADEMKNQLNDLGAAVLGNTAAGDGAQADDNRTGYHLFIHVHRAEHLGGGTQNYNPYISIGFNGFDMQTLPAQNCNTINFDECFRLPVMTPIFADSIAIRIMDHSTLASEKIIVQGRLSFSLLRMHALPPKWFNFWGFSEEEVGNVDDILGHHEAADPNFYLGRLLVSGRVQKVEIPELLKPATVKGQVFEEPPTLSAALLLDVFEVAGCPGSETYVVLQVGRKTKKSKVVKRETQSKKEDMNTPGRFLYNEGKGKIAPLVALHAADKENQLDAMISLYSNLPKSPGIPGGLCRIGFLRVKPADIPVWKGDMNVPRWVSFKPLAHLPTSLEPGQAMLTMHQAPDVVESRGVPNTKPIEFELRCYLFMGRNLDTTDGTIPHAFAQVTCAGCTLETETTPETSSPGWFQVLTMDIILHASPASQRVFTEPIRISVYDNVDDKELNMDDVREEMKIKRAELKDNLKKKKPDLNEVATMDGDFKQRLKGMGMRKAQEQFDAANFALTGNVQAKKRLGAVRGGRNLIGRTVVDFHRILRPPPPKKDAMRPKWIKLKGGAFGIGHCGDMLVGFQLMKKKYSKVFKVEPVKPEGKNALISLAVLGLRDVHLPHEIFDPSMAKIKEPIIEVEIPQPSKDETVIERIMYNKIPEHQLSEKDINKAYTSQDGTMGWEILQVRHYKAELPKNGKFDPLIRLRLLNDREMFLGEGVIFVAEMLPWIKKSKRGKIETSAHDEFELDSSEEEVDNALEDGVPVSDVDGETEAYITVVIKKEAAKVSFNKDDDKSYPPIVTWIDSSAAAKEAGVKVGDWLVAYKTPKDDKEKPCAHWSPQQALKFVEQMDSQRVRPLTLRFKCKDEKDAVVRIQAGNAQVLIHNDDENRPPKIEKDMSQDKTWKNAGVDPGWRIVDINGFCTEDMTYQSKQFQTLFKLRPAIFTCRPFGKAQAAGGGDEKLVLGKKPVQLDGRAGKLVKECEHKSKSKDGFLLHSRAPRAVWRILPITDPSHMVLRVGRNGLLDVRGVIRGGNAGGNFDEDDARARPQVTGPLEDFIPKPEFYTVPLTNGHIQMGSIKLRIKVTIPPKKEKGALPWYKKKQYRGKQESVIFDEYKFRVKIKKSMPISFRVRTYIVRGLNVSGANSGFGNPYLFFEYGGAVTLLKNKAEMATNEPRFYHTEERDVVLPEEHRFQIGLMDYVEMGTGDVEIGRSQIDLEDRWFTPAIQFQVKNKICPIEYRGLEKVVDGGGTISKGSLEMWQEILDAREAAEIPVSPLFQPPPTEVEIRVVLFDVEMSNARRLCVDEHDFVPRERIDCVARAAIDCRAYKGPQPVVQESDCHYSAEEVAEYNWRYVWSRINCVKGVPLHCQIQVSLWEQFALQRPKYLGEALIEMKNYAKKVASTNLPIDIDADVPLMNAKLTELLREDNGGMDYTDFRQEAAADEEGDDALMDEGTNSMNFTAAAIAKIKVQVMNQSHASSDAARVGLGRGEPNRDPLLTFPKTGRTWQSVMPGGAALVDKFRGWSFWAKYRLQMIVGGLVVLAVLIFLHTVPMANGCPLMYFNCLEDCKRCNECVKWSKGNEAISGETRKEYCMLVYSSTKACVDTKYMKDKCMVKDPSAEVQQQVTGEESARCYFNLNAVPAGGDPDLHEMTHWCYGTSHRTSVTIATPPATPPATPLPPATN